MKPLLRPLLALASLMAAFYLSVSYRYGDPGWRIELHTGEAAAQGDATDPEGEPRPGRYDLKSLPILNRVVLHIKENYVDPARISERMMLGAAMEEVQRSVAELLVEVERDSEKVPTRLTVRVGDQSQNFDLKDVGNLWQMSFKFKDIFRFVQTALPEHEALRDIEYAAINGMLSTLDPHSVLLRPEDYREMKLSTRGKFGGLGIVISIRDGHLTVVNPIEDTPASRAGIKPGDRIVQIGLDSTVNMALSDAVDLMRGEPGTPIDVWVQREGWEKPRKFRLERADIKVKSVAFKALPGRIGLIKLRNFQHTSSDELDAALAKLEKKGKLKGLILDMRGNPGGLLDQAIKISDRFIESGPLVTTVGYGDKMREPKMATRAGTLTDLPLAVLIDGSSASASEIVAGALKNHERALLIGQQSFGKGSVQVIYDNKDDSALKLTIAQYLTPGDRSIQSVGVPPDIETQPVVLSDEETDFFRSRENHRGEADLPAHLDHAAAQEAKGDKPLKTVRYLRDAPAKAEDDEAPEPDDDALPDDFDTEFARSLLVAAGANNRAELMVKGAKIIAETEAVQQVAIEAALKARGIDWSASTALAGAPAPTAEVKLSTEGPHQPAQAGDTVKLVATVTNTGATPFARLRATTKSENDGFDGYELLFGNVPPGESRTWSVTVKLPKSALTRRDDVTLNFAGEGAVPPPAILKVGVEQLPRPRFAMHWRVDDRATGNGDGLLQAGEEAEIVVTAQNVGEGQAYGLVGTLRDDPGEDGLRGLFIRRGRVRADDTLAPGAQSEMRFGFTVKSDAKDAVPVVLSVMDTEIREATSEKLLLQVVPANRVAKSAPVVLAPRLDARMLLRGLFKSPEDPAVATATIARADALVDGWYRVPTGDGLYAWVNAQEVLVREGEGLADLVAVPPKGPPIIQFSERAMDSETRDEALTLDGEVLSEKVIKDLLIFVNNKKVFFKTNSGGPLERLRFSARVPLEKGVNRITLVARQDEEASGRRTLIINRFEP
jgi:carboxyl-terminal processing protease